MDIELYYGPPGTGKTTTLMGILDQEINTRGLRPKDIAFVSFTKKGAQQGVERAKTLFDYPPGEFVYFRTLHSLAFRETYTQKKDVMDKRKYAEFSQKMGMHFTGYYTEEFHHSDDMFLFGNDMYRNNPKAGNAFIQDLHFETYNFVANNYKKYKDTFGYLDFTDMIKNFIDSDRFVPVKVAIIDEAQDLTTLQWEMVWKAFRHCERVYIAGDDDQAIYEWSGADVNYFLGLRGNVHVLKQSYRLPYNMVKFAKNISDQISKRVNKEYEGLPDKGSIDIVNSIKDIEINSTDSYLILSRNNCFLKPVEAWIKTLGIPYAYKGEPLLTEEHVAQINFYERKRESRIVSEAELNKLKRLVGGTVHLDKPWYEVFKWEQSLIDYVRTMVSKRPADLLTPRVNISTIHSIKGGEADHVILLTDITKNVLHNLEKNPDSEHRVFYVGATRAKKSLRIVLPQTSLSYKFV